MRIDWFTVSAQAINFLILVWLMKRYLYRPIIGAIDAREKKIAMQLADAAASKADARRERDEFARRNEDFDRQRSDLLNQAVATANGERQRLLEEARKAADAMSSTRREALQQEFEILNQAISRRAQAEVLAIARKTLADLAGIDLEVRMVEVFLRRLHEIDRPAHAELADAIAAASGATLVRSAFDLSAPQQAAIRAALGESFGAGLQLRFETVPELVTGVELGTKGRKLAWSIGDYLATLEKSVGELLGQTRGQQAAPESGPQPVRRKP